MRNLFATLLTCAALLPGLAVAQLHEGDVELSVANGQITLSGNDAWHDDGSAVFEADFGDFSGGPYLTDDPGYDSEPGTFSADIIINYTALGALQFWDGAQWSSVVPSAEYVRLDGNLGEESRWTASGVTGDTAGLIGQAGSNGQLHEHLDMRVARSGGGTPSIGAYLIQLQLTSDSYISSQPYYMVFNRGLSEDAFEEAVLALAAVPEPQSWALMAVGALAVGLVLRQRRAAA